MYHVKGPNDTGLRIETCLGYTALAHVPALAGGQRGRDLLKNIAAHAANVYTLGYTAQIGIIFTVHIESLRRSSSKAAPNTFWTICCCFFNLKIIFLGKHERQFCISWKQIFI